MNISYIIINQLRNDDSADQFLSPQRIQVFLNELRIELLFY